MYKIKGEKIMVSEKVAILFQKKVVKFKLKRYEVYECKDLVAGIFFVNTKGEHCCSLISGSKAGEIVTWFNGSEDDKQLDDGEYCCRPANLSALVKANGNSVNFVEIRKDFNSCNGYFHYKGGEFEPLNNKELRDYLVSIKKKDAFNEEAFSSETDISKMYTTIKQTILSQDEQIMQIITALFKNQKILESNLDNDMIAKLKENIMIYGSTGTGKTEILKRISKLYKIPIVIEDATSLSEVGYVGRNVTDMLEDLCAAADNDIELAEKGILVIDEFDKLAEKPGDGQSHVSRFGVQRALLKLLDGSDFYLGNKKFNTSKLTIVALGAFTGITEGDDYKKLTSDDFMNFGIMRELLGRFSKTIAMNPLAKSDIVSILKESNFSPINTYKELFKMLNVEFSYTDEFIDYIAELAIEKKSGARSIKTVFDDCISGALFRIFAGEYSAIRLVRPELDSNEAYILTKK